VEALSYLHKCKPVLKILKKRYSMDGSYPTNTKCYQALAFPYMFLWIVSWTVLFHYLLLQISWSLAICLYDTTNPLYIPQHKPESPLADINTGDAYHRSYDLLVDKANSVIVPLMIFADGILIDKNRRLVQEPWMFTLGIFMRLVCNQARAWQNLGLTKSMWCNATVMIR